MNSSLNRRSFLAAAPLGLVGSRAHAYLLELGDADPRPFSEELTERDPADLLGSYKYGPGEDEVFEVTDREGTVFFGRTKQPARGLTHLGSRVFHPAGAPSVRIAFSGSGRPTNVSVVMGTTQVDAERT